MKTREAVYKFIVNYQAEHDGLSPSLAEISAAVGKALSTVVHHIDKDKRLVRRGKRVIEVVQPEEQAQ